MRAVVERLAAHKGRRLAGYAQGQQHAPVEHAMPHRVVAVVGQPDRVVGRDMDAVRLAMGPGKDAFAPGAQQVTVPVEHRDGMLAAIEGVDIVLAVNADRRDIAEYDLVRDLRPVFLDLEGPFADAEPLRHHFLPLLWHDHRSSLFGMGTARSSGTPLFPAGWGHIEDAR